MDANMKLAPFCVQTSLSAMQYEISTILYAKFTLNYIVPSWLNFCTILYVKLTQYYTVYIGNLAPFHTQNWLRAMLYYVPRCLHEISTILYAQLT